MSGKHSESNGIDRRRFLQRVGIVGAFAVPAITTLSMSSVGDAFGASPNKHGRSGNMGSGGNQTVGSFGCSGNMGSGDPHLTQGLNEICRDLERLRYRH